MDDWFAEPKPQRTKHDWYTERLRDMGYLYHDGETLAWEVSALQRLNDILLSSYLVSTRRMLDESLYGFSVGKVVWE